jgi:hypothetical protein
MWDPVNINKTNKSGEYNVKLERNRKTDKTA